MQYIQSVAELRLEIQQYVTHCFGISNDMSLRIRINDDLMDTMTLLSGLAQLAKADGTIHLAEKLYIQTLDHELGYADDALKLGVE